MAFLWFLLFVIIVILGTAIFHIWKIYRRIHNATEQFKKQMGGGFDQNDGNYESSRSNVKTTTTDSGDTIIDRRTPEEANKKIFAKDEGEYVDFKEEH